MVFIETIRSYFYQSISLLWVEIDHVYRCNDNYQNNSTDSKILKLQLEPLKVKFET